MFAFGNLHSCNRLAHYLIALVTHKDPGGHFYMHVCLLLHRKLKHSTSTKAVPLVVETMLRSCTR